MQVAGSVSPRRDVPSSVRNASRFRRAEPLVERVEKEDQPVVLPFLVLAELLKPGTTPEKMEEVNVALATITHMLKDYEDKLTEAFSNREVARAFVAHPKRFVEAAEGIVEGKDSYVDAADYIADVFEQLSKD